MTSDALQVGFKSSGTAESDADRFGSDDKSQANRSRTRRTNRIEANRKQLPMMMEMRWKRRKIRQKKKELEINLELRAINKRAAPIH
jgi:hypothetical protein